jgi:hypothetical protein
MLANRGQNYNNYSLGPSVPQRVSSDNIANLEAPRNPDEVRYNAAKEC